jgi:hypothetical protein
MSPYRAPAPREPDPKRCVALEPEFDPSVEGAMWVVPIDRSSGDVEISDVPMLVVRAGGLMFFATLAIGTFMAIVFGAS